MGNLKVAVFMREISGSISARFTPHFVTLLLETFRGLLCGTSKTNAVFKEMESVALCRAQGSPTVHLP